VVIKMSNYAVINTVTGIVENMILWDGTEESGWYPPEGCIAVQTDVAGIGWTYVDGVFIPPPIPEVPPPTPEQILASQSTKLQGLTQLAAAQKSALTNRIGTLNDAIELEMATPEEVAELPVRQAQLLEWKRYAVYLGRVTSQEGWPPDVEWPVQPTEGMDLTVSATAPETI
jgi:hypothetical protein